MLSDALEANRSPVYHVERLEPHTGEQRTTELLLPLRGDKKVSCTVILPDDKVLIAPWLRMKPERLSRSFHRLKDHSVSIKKDHAIIELVERLSNYGEENLAGPWSA